MLIAVVPILLAALHGAPTSLVQGNPLTQPGGKKIRPFDKPPKEMQIAPAGTQNWKKSTMTLDQLATKVSEAISGMRNVVGYLDISIQTPEGMGVYRYPSMLFQVIDNQRYRYDYVVVQKVPFTCSLAADGLKRMLRLDTQVAQKPATWKAPTVNDSSQILVRRFELDFSRLAYQGLTEGVDVWRPLFHGWASNYDGFRPIVEERRITYQKHLFISYRVRVERDAATAKKLGPSAFEVVFDGQRFLPVTIRNVRRDPQGKLWFAYWTCGYQFNLKPKLSDMRLGG